jgi:hypothetical protein
MSKDAAARAFQDLLMVAEAAFRVERLLNPHCIPWGERESPDRRRTLFGSPTPVVILLHRIRELLDRLYVHCGWQAFCALSGSHDYAAVVRAGITAVDLEWADELDEFAKDLSTESRIRHPGTPNTIPPVKIAEIASLTARLAGALRRWGGVARPSRRQAGRPNKPGRKPAYSAKDDARRAQDWEAARRQGTYKGDFARQRGYSLKDFDRLLARVRRRRPRKQGAN